MELQMSGLVEQLRVGSDDLDEALVFCDRAADRIEALEAALQRIEALCSETDIINALSAIARAALNKDAEQ